MINPDTTVSLRGQRQRDRMEKLRAAIPPGIRVVPSNDDMRRVLKHPSSGGFRAQGGATWPNDRFTKRRLADGTIKREEPPPDYKNPHHRRPTGGDAD
jgi:hypothetical protein